MVTRGFLVDVSGAELEPGGVIALEHVDGLRPEPGDAVLYHTGWSPNWPDPETHLSASRALGYELAA